MKDWIFSHWLTIGIKQGWITAPYCSTHDVPVMSDEEQQEWEDGGDPCSFVTRINPYSEFYAE